MRTLCIALHILGLCVASQLSTRDCEYWVDSKSREGNGTREFPFPDLQTALILITSSNPILCVLPGYYPDETLFGDYTFVTFIGITDEKSQPEIPVVRLDDCQVNAEFHYFNITYAMLSCGPINISFYHGIISGDGIEATVAQFYMHNMTILSKIQVTISLTCYGSKPIDYEPNDEYVALELSASVFYNSIYISPDRRNAKISNCLFNNIAPNTFSTSTLEIYAPPASGTPIVHAINTSFINNTFSFGIIDVTFFSGVLIVENVVFNCNLCLQYNSAYNVPPFFYKRPSQKDDIIRINSTFTACGNKSVECPPGEYTFNEWTPCFTCPDGTAWNATSKTSCITCLPGSYSLSPKFSTECTPCPNRTFSSTYNSTECASCNLGEISNVNRTSCVPCNANTYQSDNSCIPCPDLSESQPKSTKCVAITCDLFHDASTRCETISTTGKVLITSLSIGGSFWMILVVFLLIKESRKYLISKNNYQPVGEDITSNIQ